MELGLSLGNTQSDGAFCSRSTPQIKLHHHDHDDHNQMKGGGASSRSSSSQDPTPHIHLLPFSPLPLPPHPLRFPWLPNHLSCEPGSSEGVRRRAAEEAEEQSSPNSGTSSFKEFSVYNNNKGGEQNKNNGEVVMMMGLGVTSRGHGSDHDHDHDDDDGYDDDDDQNIGLISSSSSSTRKKLRLSKEQSAFLEESFKDHHTLNPKQKVALAKQLNLRPRQVEVWFQNRRARTKLKQTEVDCEYLKRCCETLTEDNKRLQKELMQLRSFKSSQPFFMHLPPTTLTMCPSCERVAPTSSPASSPASYVPANPLLLPQPYCLSATTTMSKLTGQPRDRGAFCSNNVIV